MGELAVFRDLLRGHRRGVGRSQGQLASAIGIHPNVLSHKINGHGTSVLTTPEVIGIVTTLAGWGAFDSRASAEELLAAAGVPPHAVPPAAWASTPLSELPSVAPAPSGPSGRADASVPTPRRPEPEGAPAGRPIPPPAPLTRLIGRQGECRAVASALEATRLVTLTGVGGTGKTRLAIQVAADVAHRFPDGTGFVDLAPVRSPAMLTGAVAKACGISTSNADPTSVLLDSLSGKRVLLLVDNVEHVVEGAASLGRLLELLPGLHVLATSRVALRLYGEHVVRVPPLAVPTRSGDQDVGDAVRLFIERARAAGHPVDDTPAEQGAVRDICAAVDGLPLAIELAAAKTRTYGLAELLRRLQERAPVLDDGPRDAPTRQRTLRDTLDWSFALLPPAAQRLLASLGVLAGPFDVEAAAAVSGDPSVHGVERSLAELVDHHLVERRPGSGQPFALLQTIREYALARLAESGDEDAAERRNLTHQLEQVRAARRPTGELRSEALAILDAGYPNIRVALDHAVRCGESDPSCSTDGLLLATAAIPLWLHRGPMAEGLFYLQELLALDGRRADPRVRAEALLELCALACVAGDYRLGPDVGRECLELFEELGDHRGLARAYRYAGEFPYAVGDLDAAEPMFRHALRIAREHGDVDGQGHAGNMLGQLLTHRGARVEARRHLCDAVRNFAEVGSGQNVAATLHSLSELARADGDLAGAVQLLHLALRASVTSGSSRGLAATFEGLACIASLQGDHVLALERVGTARALRDRIGARLAPVEGEGLSRATAGTLAATTAAEQEAAFARARATSIDDACRAALSDAHPAVATGSDEELAAWTADVLAAQSTRAG